MLLGTKSTSSSRASAVPEVCIQSVRCHSVLTKDKAVRRNALELTAIRTGGVACFSLGHGNLKAEHMAQAFIAARRKMEKALRRFDPAMTASVTVTGHVRVLMAAGQLLAQPKEV